MSTSKWDRIQIKDLLVHGILGVHPQERQKPRDILVNVTLWTDTRTPGRTDKIEDTIHYGNVARAIIAFVEKESPFLTERLAADLVRVCFEADKRIQAVELTIDKLDAIPSAYSGSVTIYRTRNEVI